MIHKQLVVFVDVFRETAEEQKTAGKAGFSLDEVNHITNSFPLQSLNVDKFHFRASVEHFNNRNPFAEVKWPLL